MALKVYSDKTRKFYDTAAEAARAEFELKEQENLEKIKKERAEREMKEKKEKEAAERKVAAEKVEAARKAMTEAQTAYRKELEAFCDKYGTYHLTLKDATDIPHLFDTLFNSLWA